MLNYNLPRGLGFAISNAALSPIALPSLAKCARRKPLHNPLFAKETVNVPTPFFKIDVRKPMPVIKLHSGRTDGSFGHNVYTRPEISVFQPARTVSGQTTQGIERYHYHHGLPAHLHPNGICPYGKTTTRVEIKSPKSGVSYFIGDKLIIRADVLNALRVELLINNEPQDEKSGLMTNETVLFRQYELTVDDFGDTDVTVIAYVDEDGIEQAAIDTKFVHVGLPGNIYAKNCTTDGENFDELTDIEKNENALYIYNYLTLKGWSIQAIAGLLGNIDEECRLNPGAWQSFENVNGGYGLVQWTMEKNTEADTVTYKFFDWAEGIKPDVFQEHSNTAERAREMAVNGPKRLMNLQLEYLVTTMQPGYGQWLQGSRSQEIISILPPSDTELYKMSYEEYIASGENEQDLAIVFHAHYERSGDNRVGIQERCDRATYWIGILKDMI